MTEHDSLNSSQTRGPAAPHFQATLKPHRSLTNAGFFALMAAVGLVSMITGAMFFIAGAWPVTAFFGLDVLLVYFAFRWNYRDARRCETVEVTSERVVLTRYDARGHSQFIEFNPAWIRVDLAERPDGRTQLGFRMRDHLTPFGAFLTDDERRELARVLRDWLVEARGGVRI